MPNPIPVLKTAEGTLYYLIHRMNEGELRAFLTQHPAFHAAQQIELDPYCEGKPFKIVLGNGNSARVRLAKSVDANGNERFLAVRKVHSQNRLSEHHEHISREAALAETQAELRIQDAMNAFINKNHVHFAKPFVLKENKGRDLQLYQFLPLADFGTARSLLILAKKSALTSQETTTLQTAIAVSLIKTIAHLNENKCYVRDIKLDNLLFDHNGEMFISDFGSAAYYGDALPLYASRLSTATYFPPFHLFPKEKLCSKESIDQIHDRWALAITLVSLWHDGNNIMQSFINYYHEVIHDDKNTIALQTTYHATIKKLKSFLSSTTMPRPMINLVLALFDVDLKQLADHHAQFITQLVMPSHKVITPIFEKLTRTVQCENEHYLNQCMHRLAQHQVEKVESNALTRTSSMLFFQSQRTNDSYLQPDEDIFKSSLYLEDEQLAMPLKAIS